jgi:hypothetical protein
VGEIVRRAQIARAGCAGHALVARDSGERHHDEKTPHEAHYPHAASDEQRDWRPAHN